MTLHICMILLSLTVFVSAKISNEGDNNSLQKPNLTGCQCVNYNCGCCEHLKVKHVHLDDTVCANIIYLPDDIGIMLTITFDSYAVFNTTISARNPPPICIGQDYVKELEAEICIRFYALDANKHHFHGCLRFEVELYKVKLATYDLGCFDVGPKSVENNNQNNTNTILNRLRFSKEVPQVIMV